MPEIIEMGKISSRGQIAIPSDIRNELELEEGSRVLFVVENGAVVMKKVTSESFASITAPLRMAAKKAGLKEKDAANLVRNFRKKR